MRVVVFHLIGDNRHKRFLEKNLDVKSKKLEWEKLLEFLLHEHRVREKLNFDNKNAQLMGIRQPKGDSAGDKRRPTDGSPSNKGAHQISL